MARVLRQSQAVVELCHGSMSTVLISVTADTCSCRFKQLMLSLQGLRGTSVDGLHGTNVASGKAGSNPVVAGLCRKKNNPGCWRQCKMSFHRSAGKGERHHACSTQSKIDFCWCDRAPGISGAQCNGVCPLCTGTKDEVHEHAQHAQSTCHAVESFFIAKQ